MKARTVTWHGGERCGSHCLRQRWLCMCRCLCLRTRFERCAECRLHPVECGGWTAHWSQSRLSPRHAWNTKSTVRCSVKLWSSLSSTANPSTISHFIHFLGGNCGTHQSQRNRRVFLPLLQYRITHQLHFRNINCQATTSILETSAILPEICPYS